MSNSEDSMNNDNIESVNQIYLAFFIYEQEQRDLITRNFWETIAQDKPDQRSQNPKNGYFQEVGIYNAMLMEIDGSGDRINISLSPQDPETRLLLSREQITSIIDQIVNSLEVLFSDVVIMRYGMIIKYSEEVASKYESYESIRGVLNIPLESDKASDFLYRINYPVEIDQDIFNVVSTWSTMTSTIQRLLQNSSPNPLIKLKFFKNIDVDINTVPQRTKPISLAEIIKLTPHLVKIAFNVAQRGPSPDYDI